MKKSLILLLPFFISFAIASASLAASRDASPIEVAEPAPVVERTKVVEPAPVVERTKVAEPAPVVERTKVAEPAPVVERTKVVNPDSMRPTSGTSIINPDSMRPTSGTRVTDPSNSAAAGPTPHPSPREEPQEISLEEQAFIKNLKEEDKRSWSANGRQYQVIKSIGCENGQISLIGDEQFICNNNQWAGPIGKKLSVKDDKTKPILNEKMLAQIESDVDSAWEKARKKIADMSEAELSAMYAGFVQASLKDLLPELFDEEDLTDSDNSPENLKKKSSIKGKGILENLKSEEQQIWADYEEKVAALKAEYLAAQGPLHEALISDPLVQSFNALKKAAEAPYKAIYWSLKAQAGVEYNEEIALLPSKLEEANLVAEEQYALAKEAADNEEDLSAAFINYADALFKAQSDFDNGPAVAEAKKKAKISKAWSNLTTKKSEIRKAIYASNPDIASAFKAHYSKINPLYADYKLQLLEAEQERDEALAALESK